MKKEYVGKVVNLPIEAHQRLETIRKHLETRLGFTPSLSETILFLVTDYERRAKQEGLAS